MYTQISDKEDDKKTISQKKLASILLADYGVEFSEKELNEVSSFLLNLTKVVIDRNKNLRNSDIET